jgi:hypothetical protein
MPFYLRILSSWLAADLNASGPDRGRKFRRRVAAYTARSVACLATGPSSKSDHGSVNSERARKSGRRPGNEADVSHAVVAVCVNGARRRGPEVWWENQGAVGENPKPYLSANLERGDVRDPCELPVSPSAACITPRDQSPRVRPPLANDGDRDNWCERTSSFPSHARAVSRRGPELTKPVFCTTTGIRDVSITNHDQHGSLLPAALQFRSSKPLRHLERASRAPSSRRRTASACGGGAELAAYPS